MVDVGSATVLLFAIILSFTAKRKILAKASILNIPFRNARACIPKKEMLLKKYYYAVKSCSICLSVEYSFPCSMLLFIPLIFVAAVIGNRININTEALQQIPRNIFRRELLIHYIVATQIGIIGGLAYRGSFHMPLLPTAVTSLFLLAPLLG